MLHVYLVWGATGEYADHRDWVVCAYATEAEATLHAERAQARAAALMVEYSHWSRIPLGANEWDPRMDVDYTGVTYTCGAVELKRLDTPA